MAKCKARKRKHFQRKNFGTPGKQIEKTFLTCIVALNNGKKKGYKSWVSLSVEEKSVNFIRQNDVSSLPYKQIITCCFVCKLPVQPATTFQEIHVLNIDFNSHYEIKNMNNICRDTSGSHSTYIRMPCCSVRALRKTCFVGATWKRFLVIKLLLTCMYT